jgi:hypothetical protein
MINEVILKRAIVVVFITSMFAGTGIAYAFDMCNMMNPSKWRGDYRDRRDRDDYYRDSRVDSGHGYRGRSYGYDSPRYDYGGPPARGYGYTAPRYGAPHARSDALQAEIDQLKQRIRNLEKALPHESFRPQSAPTAPGTG